MAQLFQRMNKGILLIGGALVVAALVLGVMTATTSPVSVSAQASPTVRPATPAVVATPVRTATPAAARTATPAAGAPAAAGTVKPIATIVPTGTPRAPSTLPANGDSSTFPAVAIALLGAGLIGLGLFARFSIGKSRA